MRRPPGVTMTARPALSRSAWSARAALPVRPDTASGIASLVWSRSAPRTPAGRGHARRSGDERSDLVPAVRAVAAGVGE